MSAVLSEAENKFFQSGGTEVDSSLGTPSEPQSTPDTPPSDPKPAESAPPAAPTPPKAAETPPPQPKTDESRVPLEALHAERDRRRQMEQQLQQMQQQWNQLQQALQQAQQPQEQPPDPDADPIGYVRWENKQLRAAVEQLGQKFGQQEQMTQQQAHTQRLTQHLTASEAQFSQTQPDYFQAADFALKREDLRLQAFYPDPQVRQQILRQEIANVVTQALQSGTNPAQIIYQHAKNMGYQVAQPAAPPAGAPPATAPAPPAAPPEVPEAVQKIQKGLKQQTNLSAGGSTPPSELTPEMGANLSGKEFDKFWDQMKRSARR